MAEEIKFDLENGIDLTQVDTDSHFEPIPKGTYQASLRSLELKKSNEKKDQMWVISFEITEEGDYKGRIVFKNAMLEGAGKKYGVQFITKMVLAILSDKVDVSNFDVFGFPATGVGIGTPCTIKLKVTPAKGKYDAGNEVTQVAPAGSGGGMSALLNG
jgi:hypothetical protein